MTSTPRKPYGTLTIRNILPSSAALMNCSGPDASMLSISNALVVQASLASLTSPASRCDLEAGKPHQNSRVQGCCAADFKSVTHMQRTRANENLCLDKIVHGRFIEMWSFVDCQVLGCRHAVDLPARKDVTNQLGVEIEIKTGGMSSATTPCSHHDNQARWVLCKA